MARCSCGALKGTEAALNDKIFQSSPDTFFHLLNKYPIGHTGETPSDFSYRFVCVRAPSVSFWVIWLQLTTEDFTEK